MTVRWPGSAGAGLAYASPPPLARLAWEAQLPRAGARATSQARARTGSPMSKVM